MERVWLGGACWWLWQQCKESLEWLKCFFILLDLASEGFKVKSWAIGHQRCKEFLVCMFVTCTIVEGMN